MEIQAVAKTNLYLAVVGKRADGYHEIESLMVRIPQLADRLRLAGQAGEGIELSCSGGAVPNDAGNLVWRAAQRFAEVAGVSPNWRLELEKRIPVAAGLGGGSSDAAATLLALNRWHGEPLSAAALAAIATSLGADVPFFLGDSPCLVRGIGEQLSPLPAGLAVPLVLVNPGFPLSTAWAYGQIRPGPGPGLEAAATAFAAGDLERLAAACHNAFEAVVLRKFPLLQLIVRQLQEAGCLAVHLSGSGPTIFGLAADLAAAANAAASVDQAFDQAVWTWSGLAN